MRLTKSFIQWACSLSGCDGGDPGAAIWISGIESGHPSNDKDTYYSEILPREIKQGTYTPKGNYDWIDQNKNPYGKNVAKLYTAIKDLPVNDYLKHLPTYDKTKLFKLNLYPIAFNNTHQKLWSNFNLKEITGFEEKHLFRTWCYLHRFPEISKIVTEQKPKLIIGTGITYLTDFFACFAGTSKINTIIHHNTISPKRVSKHSPLRNYYHATLDCGTTIVVIPFFSGHYGLNSNHLIQEMGSKIRQLITNPDLL